MSTEAKIQVGIIGIGKHGSRYAHHIVQDLPDYFQLGGISRRSAVGAGQAAEWKTKWFSDWRVMVKDPSIKAVIAATTPNLNGPIGECCAAAGKPLLLEKPLATDYFTAQKIVGQFKARGVALTAGQTLRYNNVVKGLKENLSSLGTLFSLSACQHLEPSTLPWLTDPEIAGGGVIFHTAVHVFDALRFITGREIVRVRASTRKIHNPNLEDLLSAEAVFADGSYGVIEAGKVSPGRLGRYEFIGQHGILFGDQIHSVLKKIDGSGCTDISMESPGPTILPLLRDWRRFLNGQAKNPIAPEAGLDAVQVCHAVRLAAERGGWVEINGFK